MGFLFKTLANVYFCRGFSIDLNIRILLFTYENLIKDFQIFNLRGKLSYYDKEVWGFIFRILERI